MSVLNSAILILFKRPFLIIFSGALFLILSIINFYNPVNAIFPLIFGFGQLSGGNIYDSMINLIHFLLGFIADPKIILKSLLYVVVFLAGASIISGVIFSGYFNVISGIFERKPALKGYFRTGVKRKIVKMSVVSLIIIIVSIIFVTYMLIVSMPSLIVTRAASSGKPEMLFPAIILDTLTVGVFFFGFMFYRTYISFWFLAAFHTEKNSFRKGKQIADIFFWKIAGRFIIFDLVFAVIYLILAFTGYSLSSHGTGGTFYSVFLLIIKWLFNTIFFTILLSYIFTLYRDMSARLKKSREV